MVIFLASISGCADHQKVKIPAENKLSQLTAEPWIIDEVVRNVAGVNSHYIRGGINTTNIKYQNYRIKFNSDGTGSFTDDQAETFPMTWSFVGNKQQDIRIDVSGFVVYDWHMVELHHNYLYATTSGDKNNNMNTARYIQVSTAK